MATLGSDIYKIQEFNEELLKTNIDEDSSTLALGIFGYLEDSFSHIMQNNIILSSEYINEMFPTRVKYEKSIMDYAMLYNVDEINATPSTMNVLLCLLESEVENVLKKRSDETFIIDRDQAFYFGEYEFHLEYDIELKRSKLQNKTVMYTATYNNSTTNPISKISTPYLTTPYRQTINGYTYIFINCIIRQVTYSEVYKKIITSNPILNKSLEFEFGDQLSSFSIQITQGNTEFNVTPLLDGSSNVGLENNYCYYRFIDSNNIRLLFDSDSYIPKLNDEITIFIQATKGVEGNFEYTEDVTTNISSEKYGYDNIPLLIKPISNAQYGENKTTIDELKKIIPREAVARGSITSTTDLYNYFNTISSDTNKLTFVKKADNQFERLYYSYLLVKNDYGEIVPTNTINIKLLYYDSNDSSNIDFDNSVINRYILKPGNHFKYYKNDRDSWIGERVLSDSSNYLENYLDGSKNNDFVYTNPFLIILNTKPLLYASYYLNMVNKTYSLLTDSDSINKDSELQFIALSCDWTRGYKEDRYKLSFQCTQNINEDRGMVSADENGDPKLIDGEYITKLRAILTIGDYSEGSSDTTSNCFVEGKLTGYNNNGTMITYQFDFEIPTEDKINSNNKLEIYNVYGAGLTPVQLIEISKVQVRNKILIADGEYQLESEKTSETFAQWKKTVDNENFIISHTESDSDSSIREWGWNGYYTSYFTGEDIITIKSPGRPISDNLERIEVENISVKASIGLDKGIGEYLFLKSDGNIISWMRTIVDEFEETGEFKEYSFIVSYNTTTLEWGFEMETTLDLSSATFSDIKEDNDDYSPTLTVKDIYSYELVDVIDGTFELYNIEDNKTTWNRKISSEVEYSLEHIIDSNEWILYKKDQDTKLSVNKEDIRMENSIVVSNAFNSTNTHDPTAEGIYYQSNETEDYTEWKKGTDKVYIVRYRKNESSNPWLLIGPGSPDGERFSYFDVVVNDPTSVNVLKVTDTETGENIKLAAGTYALYENTTMYKKWKLDVYNKTYYLIQDIEGNYTMESIIRYDDYIMDQTENINIRSVENMSIYILYEDETVEIDNALTTQLKKKIVPSSYPISLNNYVVSNVYSVNGEDGGEFFFNYTDIISSKVTVTQESGDNDDDFKQYIHLESVPMVRAAYLDEEKINSEELVDIIETKRGYIENALSVLEDQFGIDLKFYNTYGPSRTFYIDNDLLDRVDIQIRFEISLKAGADKTVINLIKDDIKKYVENLNNTEYNIHMSNLITEITNKYNMDSLYYIEFNNINGNTTSKQFLSRISTSDLNINTPPEFINIHNIYTEENGKLVNSGIGITMDIVV